MSDFIVTPSNTIVVGGSPFTKHYKVEVATSMVPGRLVITGTNEDDVIIGTADSDKTLGLLGFEEANTRDMPDTITTAYATDAQAPVHSGRFLGQVFLASGATVAPGDKLQAAASGEVVKFLDVAIKDVANIVGYARQDSSGNELIFAEMQL